MAGLTPDQIAQKWANNLGSSTAQIQAGVQAVTVAPGQAAARQKAVYLANVQQSVDKWAANTAAVSLNDWQQAMVNKGVQRIASGASAAQPRMAQVMTQLLPQIESIKSSLPARGSLDQNINRMVQFARGMSNVQIRK